MKFLEGLREQIEGEHQSKFDALYWKYVESDQALIKYKREVSELKAENLRLQQKSLEDDNELGRAWDAVRHMEEEVYAKNKELKDVNKLWEELRATKQLEEALNKKI